MHPIILLENSCELLFDLLLQAGALAGAFAQVVQLGAPHVRMALHRDLLQAGRVVQECTLNADTVGRHTADGEILVIALAARSDWPTVK